MSNVTLDYVQRNKADCCKADAHNISFANNFQA